MTRTTTRPTSTRGATVDDMARLPTDEQHHANRDAGRYICTCTVPAPTALPPWNAIECARCYRPVLLATTPRPA